MSKTLREDVRGILNETSMTIHKQATEAEDFQTLCGQTYHLNRGQLRTIPVKRATGEFDAEKCGRCFEDGRGY